MRTYRHIQPDGEEITLKVKYIAGIRKEGATIYARTCANTKYDLNFEEAIHARSAFDDLSNLMEAE